MDKKDLQFVKACKTLLREGTFELKGGSIPKFFAVYDWLDRMEVELENPNVSVKPKEIAEPKKDFTSKKKTRRTKK